ncbi:hypothetical protein NQ176_g6925 [Zarea fungicola]|uniref:Uncharacterized protein n=1 Tax=Zarea fungicola TaxID=93591 RepID=A0ACC1N2Z6_9HYPO|nr:hypothetical protein NQ176_g6925 [Lecanicillium fungicola]
MAATFDDGEKNGGVLAVSGGGVDIQRSISNTIAHVDGAVSVPPTDAEKNQATAKHDINNKIIDEERQVDDRSDATAVDDQEDDGSGGAAPDGGLQAWMVVLGAWCASFCSYGWINSVGIFQQYYEEGPLHNYSASQISWIPALQIFFMSFMGPLVGVLFDKYGPVLLLIVGSFMHVFGLMMASISTKYYQFLLSQGVAAPGPASTRIHSFHPSSGSSL